MSLSGILSVKLNTCDVSCFIIVLPVASTQFGEENGVDALIEKPFALHPTGKLGGKTLSKFSKDGKTVICANAVRTKMENNSSRNRMEKALPLVMKNSALSQEIADVQ
jgi:hypothetical protein